MKKTFSLFRLPVILMILILPLNFVGCKGKSANENTNYKINIAEQYGLAYAPLQIMKANKLLEKNLPGIEVNFQQLGNTAAIREAMLSNKLDAGFMAIPPFLIGTDKGMDWKIASGLSSSPTQLITYKNNIKSLKDFSSEDKIALPQPGSVQHILLSMACEKEFGDSHKLDNIITTLSHPDGMSSLMSKKSISAHFTSPPYIYKELEDKAMYVVLDGKDVMDGDFTFIVGVTTKEFYNKNPKVYSAFVKSIQEAIDFINKNPEKSAEILSPIYNLSKEDTLKYLTWSGNKYSSEVQGLEKFSKFMVKNKYISKEYALKDVKWEDVKNEK